LERLERALSRLHAVARGDSRNLAFGKSQLMTNGHKLATTDAGALDVLGSINDGLLYDDLLGSSDQRWSVGGATRAARNHTAKANRGTESFSIPWASEVQDRSLRVRRRQESSNVVGVVADDVGLLPNRQLSDRCVDNVPCACLAE